MLLCEYTVLKLHYILSMKAHRHRLFSALYIKWKQWPMNLSCLIFVFFPYNMAQGLYDLK